MLKNETQIIDAMNDMTLINELKITPEDIVKCVKIAKSEVDELEEIINKSYEQGESFEKLCKRLGGHNLSLNEKYPYYNYFDLNYKSLLITVKQELDENNNPIKFLLQKDDVYIYPNNIYNGAADNLFTLNFEENIDFDYINDSININYEESTVNEEIVEIDYQKIENGKQDVQQLLKTIFDSYKEIQRLHIDRINYKMSIYNQEGWLNRRISNIDYSDLLGCILDIQDDFIDVKEYIENALNEINVFKDKYINEPDMEEENEDENAI